MPVTSSPTRAAFAALCAGLLACASWLPARGLAVYARSDLHGYFVPELELHLNGAHAYGPALWDPHVQLGRPASHSGGISQSYWLNHAVSWVLDDAWTAYTALVLATLVLGGLFAWGFFRTLDLHPWAAAACALGFAYAPFHGHAGLYLCFVGGSAWTMGLAWALLRNLRARTLANGLLLAFVVHSAILASYPQQLVWAGWIGLGVVVACFPPRGQRLPVFLALLGWSAVGVLSTAPFLLELLENARASSRFRIDPDYFQVPLITSARDALLRVRELGDPLWNGRKPFGAYQLWGGTLTPFFGAALLYAVTAVRSRLVLVAGGLVLAMLLFSLSNTLFYFGVRYLGLWLSLYHPFTAATVPIFLLAAVGLDRALRVPGGRRRRWLALPLPVLLVAGAFAAPEPLARWNAAVSLLLAACAALALIRPAWPFLAAGALLSAVHFGVLELPAVPRAKVEERVRWHDPLAQEVARRAGDGRFAWVSDARVQPLGCNTEQLYGLRSIHSFDSLSSRRYQAWTERISERGTDFFGRFFEYVVGVSRLGTEDFARSGVRVVLAEHELASPVLTHVGKTRQVHVHDVVTAGVVAPGPLEAWVPLSACELARGEARIPAPIARVGEPVTRRSLHDERIRIELTPRAEPGLLWLSQQFHPRWRARANGAALETVTLEIVMIDGFWQGVRVPAGVGAIELEFRPWMRWWWVSQLAFALAGLALLVRARMVRQLDAPERAV